jgi:two-component system nitrate/nitrite sensor histidine kinase NarX
MERIEHSLDEANIELRELIADFRAPVTAHGLVPALRKLLSRFRKESGTETVLQNQSGELVLDGEAEVQILRIVREALNNARKHSQANMVRVLLSQGPHGLLRVMIEDDGAGISPQVDDGAGDQHFGLAIMRERAASIGGNLHIESEPGEGTRVVLEWAPQAEEQVAAIVEAEHR